MSAIAIPSRWSNRSLARRIRIEKGIPMPARYLRQRKECPYPFMDMEIGDSFFVPITTSVKATHKHISIHRIRFIAANPGYEFKARSVDSGVRCWRTK